MEEATLEDLAFSHPSSREPDEVGRETIPKTFLSILEYHGNGLKFFPEV